MRIPDRGGRAALRRWRAIGAISDTNARDSAPVAAGIASPALERRLRAALTTSNVLPFLVVLALAVVVPLLVAVPPPYGDAYHVWRGALTWPMLEADPLDVHHVMRIGVLLPVRVFQELFGNGQLAFVAAATVLNGLLAVGTYAAGAALFGRVTGVAAVTLLLIHPFFVVVNPYASATSSSTGSLLPDMPASGMYALAVAALVVAARSEGRRHMALLVAAGVAFGVSYLMREFVAMMFVGIPFFAFLLRIPLRSLFVVGTTMAGVFGVELVHSTLVFGHPLARLRVAAEHGADNIPDPPTTGEVLGRFLEATLRYPLGPVFALALGIIAVGWLVSRDRRLLLTLAWFLALWVPLTLAAGILNPDSPSLRAWLVRYWTPIFPALLIGALGTVPIVAARLPSLAARRIAITVVALVVGVLYVVPAAGLLASVPRDTAWNELRAWLAAQDDLPRLWTDGRTAQTLTFYTRTPTGEPVWTGTVSTYRQQIAELPAEASEGPVLYTPRYGPKEVPSEATGWRLVWQSSDGKILSIWDR